MTLDAASRCAPAQVPFRTELGLDVLPVEGAAFVKQPLAEPAAGAARATTAQLYASLPRRSARSSTDVQLYETVAARGVGQAGVDARRRRPTARCGSRCCCARATRRPPSCARSARAQLAGRTLSLGIVPVLADPRRARSARRDRAGRSRPRARLPDPAAAARRPAAARRRPARPRYRSLDGRADGQRARRAGHRADRRCPTTPALAAVGRTSTRSRRARRLPARARGHDARGRGSSPGCASRPPRAPQARAAVGRDQRGDGRRSAREVAGEVLPHGTGEPDQVVRLARTPVVAGTVAIEVTPPGGDARALARDRRPARRRPRGARAATRARRPGTPPPPPARRRTCSSSTPRAGEVRFGDGAARPPAAARRRAARRLRLRRRARPATSAPGRSRRAPGAARRHQGRQPGAAPGAAPRRRRSPRREKQAARYLQHRDRLVTAEDFEAIVRRTPGVELGRVEVLPTFNPQRRRPPAPTPGAVTLLVVPRFDALHPTRPSPDRLFLDAICRYLDPRRLVTTEVFLRGPDVRRHLDLGRHRGRGRAQHRGRSARRSARTLTRFLAPIDPDAPDWFEEQPATLADDLAAHPQRGWPLGKAVQRLELIAVASRVAGVRLVSGVQLAAGTGAAGRRACRSPGCSCRACAASRSAPTAADLDQLRGQQAAPADAAVRRARPGRPGDVLMDANGTRYHLLLGERRLDGGVRARRRAAGSVRATTGARERADAAHALPFRVRAARRATARRALADRRGAARDRFGNLYWIDAGRSVDPRAVGRQRRCLACSGSPACSAPLPEPARRRRVRAAARGGRSRRRPARSARRAGGDRGPLPGRRHARARRACSCSTCTPPGRRARRCGRPTCRSRRSTCAPRRGGGVFVLDRDTPAPVGARPALARRQREPAPTAPARADFAPRRPPRRRRPRRRCAAATGDRGSTTRRPLGGDPIAIEAAPDGRVLVLDRDADAPPSTVAAARPGGRRPERRARAPARGARRSRVVGARHGARRRTAGSGTLYVADAERQPGVRVRARAAGDGALARDARRTTTSRCGCSAARRSWPAPDGAAATTSATAGSRSSRQRAPALRAERDARHARVRRPRSPARVWHRLLLDGCIPPETAVAVESRAGRRRATSSPARRGSPSRRSSTGAATGSELPFAPPDRRAAYGTWELLFQRARGRYLQLRLDARGDGRAHAAAARAARLLPALLLPRALPARRSTARTRESASFLDRFLANLEGIHTGDRGPRSPPRRCCSTRAPRRPRRSTGCSAGSTSRPTRPGDERAQAAVPAPRDASSSRCAARSPGSSSRCGSRSTRATTRGCSRRRRAAAARRGSSSATGRARRPAVVARRPDRGRRGPQIVAQARALGAGAGRRGAHAALARPRAATPTRRRSRSTTATRALARLRARRCSASSRRAASTTRARGRSSSPRRYGRIEALDAAYGLVGDAGHADFAAVRVPAAAAARRRRRCATGTSSSRSCCRRSGPRTASPCCCRCRPRTTAGRTPEERARDRRARRRAAEAGAHHVRREVLLGRVPRRRGAARRGHAARPRQPRPAAPPARGARPRARRRELPRRRHAPRAHRRTTLGRDPLTDDAHATGDAMTTFASATARPARRSRRSTRPSTSTTRSGWCSASTTSTRSSPTCRARPVARARPERLRHRLGPRRPRSSSRAAAGRASTSRPARR